MFLPEAVPKPMPNPPRLHWGWVLAGVLLTRGLFAMVWLLVQADWVRRVNGKSLAFWWAVANVCIIPALILLVVIEAAVQSAVGGDMSIVTTITGIGTLCVAITGLCTVFILRYELECEPIGIGLGKVATFFLGTIYFQYHLRDYNMENRAAVDGSLGLTS